LPESNVKAHLPCSPAKTQQGEMVRTGEEEFTAGEKTTTKENLGNHQHLNQGKHSISALLDAANMYFTKAFFTSKVP